jgi:hypothetical protein
LKSYYNISNKSNRKGNIKIMSHQEIITQIGTYSVLLRNLNSDTPIKGLLSSKGGSKETLLGPAFDSGLSSSHLISQSDSGHDALIHGKQLYKDKELEAALNQAIIALKRMPIDVPVLSFTCDCYARLYLKYNRDELLFATTQLAEIILLFDPRNPQAIHLREEFVEQRQRVQRRKQMNFLMFSGMRILFVYALWATLIYDPTLSEEEMQQMRDDIATKDVDFPDDDRNPEEVLGIPSLQSDPKFGDFQSNIAFEINSPDLEGLHVEDAGSYLEFQPDNNKINLYFKGYLQNNTSVELRSVEATLRLLHDDILIHKIKFSMLPLYKGPIRPMDSVSTDAILSKVIDKTFYKHPNRIVIDFSEPSIQPPPSEYPVSEPIDIYWETKDKGSEVIAKSRHFKVTKEMISKYWTVDQFEIYNAGNTQIHTLKMEVRYFDSTDKMIKADAKYVVTSNGALFMPDQYLLLDFRNDLKKRPRRKELIITSVEVLDSTQNTLSSIQKLSKQANIAGVSSINKPPITTENTKEESKHTEEIEDEVVEDVKEEDIKEEDIKEEDVKEEDVKEEDVKEEK